MYLPIPPKESCARSWVAAASAVVAARDEAYNVIVDVEQPNVHDTQDHAVISLVDRFLRDWGQNPISTVANTIFPQALYEEHGAPAFYREYWQIFDRLQKGWGRYFERMTRHKKLTGEVYNPLEVLIERLRDRKDAQKYTSAYELAVYDPLRDGRAFRGGQCLSFLSFKLHPDRGLCLTAIYRNHTYITRCLGNLIGLGRLQAFIAKEAGLAVGSLTCVSTHAEIDVGDGERRWGIISARKLISDAAELLRPPAAVMASSRADQRT